jgi:hypothetical protein
MNPSRIRLPSVASPLKDCFVFISGSKHSNRLSPDSASSTNLATQIQIERSDSMKISKFDRMSIPLFLMIRGSCSCKEFVAYCDFNLHCYPHCYPHTI